MCGIIHIKRQTGVCANKSVIKRYQKQKSRGTEGFGFIEMKNGVVIGGKRAEEEKDILKALEESDADEILFHHRTPTSTPNFIESTHPIEVKNKSLKYDYYVVHNGIIYNDVEMRKKHIEEGFIYTTDINKIWETSQNTYSSVIFNDSEAVAIDFVKSIEKGEFMSSRGSIAIIALQVNKKTKKAKALFYAHNTGNPLRIELGKDLFGISSESGKELKTNILYKYDYDTEEITEEYKTIGINSYYGGDSSVIPEYGHYDPNTGQWIDNKPSYNYEEDDYDDESIDEFDYEWDIMLEEIDEEIRQARKNENWDIVNELEEEKADLLEKYNDLSRGAKKESKKKRRRMGF